MANYYTEASFILPLTSEQQEFAFNVLDCIQDKKIDLLKKHKNAKAKSYDRSIYSLAKKFAKVNDEYEQGDDTLGFDVEPNEDGIWISHDESINTENAAFFCHLILKHFDSNDYVAIQASNTCSKPRLDAFGGHAAFVTKKGIRWISTFEWIQKQINNFKRAA